MYGVNETDIRIQPICLFYAVCSPEHEELKLS